MNRIIVAAALAVVGAGTANATELNFSYTTQSGITAQGTLSATDLGGFYIVDDVQGSRNGATVTGYDFFDPTPQSFNYSGGQASNVDFSYYIGADNFEIRWPGGGSSFGTEFRTDAAGSVTSLLVTSFSLSPPTQGVPEPASWAMMIAGFGMIGASLRGRSRNAVSV